MGMTLAEKVISRHSGRSAVRAGDRIVAEVDRVFCYGAALDTLCTAAEGETPLYPGRIVISLDQFAGDFYGWDQSRHAPAIRERARTWKTGRFYDLGRGGLPAVSFPDSGLVRPGDLLAGADRQMLLNGALGAVPLVLDIRALRRAVFEGEVEISVPGTVRIELTGKLERWVGGHDIGVHLSHAVDRAALDGKAVEIGGSVAADLDLHDRFSLAAALDHAGAAMILVDADDKTRVHVKSRCDGGFPLLTSDGDAAFDEVMTVDCAGLRPQILFATGEEAKPNARVEESRGLTVDHVIIGGSSHGRIEELRVVAHFLRDYLVKPGVTLNVVPGSQQVLLHAMDEGLTQIIIRAGGHIGPPSGQYIGRAHRAAVAAGGRVLSAAFCPGMSAGGMGAGDLPQGPGSLAFCTPAMATVAAIMGAVQTPLDLARKVKRMATGMTR